MRRGEVWWVDFEPARGGEIRKKRPAVIISIDASNAALNRVQVVPLTSSTSRIYPCEALVSVQGKPSKALADRLTTAAKERFSGRLGVLSASDLAGVERAVRTQLGLID